MKVFKEKELKLLWPFYLETALNLFFIFGAFIIIYLKSINLSLFEIGILISSWSLAGIIFEIPTGAIADLKGRKFSTILGTCLMGILMILTYFTQGFYSLLLIFFFIGFSQTFVSGANEAWIVDLVKSEKKKNLIDEYFKKNQSIMSFAMLFSGFIGAYFVKEFGLGIIWVVTGSQLILGAAILSFGKENFKKKDGNLRSHLKRLKTHTKNSFNYSIKHQALSSLLVALIFFSIAMAFSGDIVWQPFLLNLGLPDYWFGYLFSATFALGILAPILINPISKKLGGKKRYLVICLIFMALFLFLVGFVNSLIFAIGLFVLSISMLDFFYPVDSMFFHSVVPNKMRATIGSLKSLIISLVGVIIYPLVGLIADSIGPKYTIAATSIILIPAIVFYGKIKENK